MSKTNSSNPLQRFATYYEPLVAPGIHFGEELSRTHQSFKEECDINNIVKKAEKAGFFPPQLEQQYGDFSDPVDFREAMELVLHAEEQFSSLPANVRARFGNSPEAFLEFATDANNAEELVRLGLATKREPEPTQTPQTGSKEPTAGEKPPKS